ncbi:putative ribonuclease H-like domain-containing protein [Tanacetum coccineum]
MTFGHKRTLDQREKSMTQEFYDLVEDAQMVDVSEDQSMTQTETQSQTQPSSHKDEAKPLLDEVTFVGSVNSKNPGGAKVWKGKKADIKRCPAILADREKYIKLLNKVQNAEKAGVSKSLKNSVISKKHNSCSSSSKKPLEQSFGLMERHAVDLKIMRGLCANGIPFNVLRNPQFHEMVSAINKAPPGYKAPSSEKARTVLLDECARDVEKDLTSIQDTWFTQGVSIVSDGWSNVKHEPLINVLAVNSRGATFLHAKDFSGVKKTGEAIANYLLGAIEKIGPSHVLQVVTDNAENCKAAGKEIEKVYKHIFWSPCSVHTLNLIFKDFAKKFNWLEDVYNRGKMVVKFFLNHSQALAIFRDNSKLELLKVAQTRFASHYILLKRLKDCREALATTVVLNSWREWAKQGDENTKKTGELVVQTIQSESFWIDVDHILAVTKPIFLLIKFCDGDGPRMGEIYERMDNMVGEIKDVMKDNIFGEFYPEVEKIILARWDKMTIPLHCLGFALTPRFYDARYIEALAPGGQQRRAPNLDKEVMMGVIDAFERIAENQEEDDLLRKQFAHLP